MVTATSAHATFIGNGPIARRPTEPFLLRIGHEAAPPVDGCYEESCASGNMRPTDLYCQNHERLVVFRSPATSGRRIALAILVLALCGAFLLAGQMRSGLPVLAVAAIIGAFAVALPLRRFPSNRAAVLVVWLLAVPMMLMLSQVAPPTGRVIWRVLIIALVAAATLYLVRRTLAAAERIVVATTLVPAAVGTAFLVLVTLLRADPLRLLQPIGSAAATVLLLFAAACWLTAVVVAVVVGVVDGMAESVLPVRPLLLRRRPPARRTAAGGIVEHIGSAASSPCSSRCT